jgi:hypothetical protein
MRHDTIKIERVLPLCAAVLMAVTCNGWARIIYVDDDANGPGDGTSRQNACKYLQDALTDAGTAPKQDTLAEL